VSSRDAVLKDLRRNAPAKELPLPDAASGIVYPDPIGQFAAVFTGVGGKFVRVATQSEVTESGRFAPQSRICSLIPGVGNPSVDIESLNDPHGLEGIDVAILAGEFGVAENGAVWISGSALGRHRAIFVITQQLVLVLRADQIVHNMHQAYERIRFERPGFGVFISGPSKTADIEQSLVIGAHGPRSCTLFLVG
jgi:L-lactate dehydrogenase complex protein LldG